MDDDRLIRFCDNSNSDQIKGRDDKRSKITGDAQRRPES